LFAFVSCAVLSCRNARTFLGWSDVPAERSLPGNMTKDSWSAWVLKVETEDEARRAIRESSIAFYVVAAVQAVGIVIDPSALWDVMFHFALAFWLGLRASRVAAVLLVVSSGLMILSTSANLLGVASGGRNVLLAAFAFWAALRAAVATVKLPKLKIAAGGVLLAKQ
jgi:hypothetical protein